MQLQEETHQKYEYYNGYVEAMAGETYEHNTITKNILSEINMKLKAKLGQIMNSDTKLYLENSYLYPDAMIFCREKVENYKDAFKNPVVIKFYQNLPKHSIEEINLIYLNNLLHFVIMFW